MWIGCCTKGSIAADAFGNYWVVDLTPESKNWGRSLQRSDETWQFIDLRNAKLGGSFSWGRCGTKTANKRSEFKRIFAYQQKLKWQRLKDAIV